LLPPKVSEGLGADAKFNYILETADMQVALEP